MSETKKCPGCELPIKATASACSCGWRAVPKPTTKTKQEPERDPEPWRCAHEILGQRCPDAGPHKRGDKWLCAFHAGKRPLADTLASEAGRAAIARARDMLRKAKPLKRVGDARPIGELVKPYEDIAREHVLEDVWPEGRE